jgi:hypothetical protein
MIIVDPTECIITELVGHMREGRLMGNESGGGDTMLFKTGTSPGGRRELSIVSLPGFLQPDIFRLQKRVERFILSDGPAS